MGRQQAGTRRQEAGRQADEMGGRMGSASRGQVVHLSTAQRRELATLTLALARRRADAEAAPEALAAAAARMGFVTRRMEHGVLAELCSVLFDRDVAGEGPR